MATDWGNGACTLYCCSAFLSLFIFLIDSIKNHSRKLLLKMGIFYQSLFIWCHPSLYIMVRQRYGKNSIKDVTPLEWALAGIAGIEGFSHYIQYLKEKNKKFKN